MMPARNGMLFFSTTFSRSTRRTASSLRACRWRRSNPELTSLTNALHAVNWQEREIQDLFGLKLDGPSQPAALRAARRLAGGLSAAEGLRPADAYCRRSRGRGTSSGEVEGEGVFQVPVGPVHAGIIEPGHFLFSVAGEPVLYLQLRLFYTHKGTEKLFENLPVPHGVRLAESISGDSSFAHATAFCHAVERAAGVEAPPRRARPAHRLPGIGAALQPHRGHRRDLHRRGVRGGQLHAMRLKERVLRLNEQLTGNRLLRGMACVGGVRFDWDAAQLRRRRPAGWTNCGRSSRRWWS